MTERQNRIKAFNEESEVPWLATACILIGLLIIAFGGVSRLSTQVDSSAPIAMAQQSAPQQEPTPVR
jgi:hypothetical protein